MCAIARLLLIVINLIFFLLGTLMLGVGIWVIVDSSYLLTLISNFDTGSTNVGGLLASSAYIIIAFGAFVFVLGFFGLCGAWKEIKLFLTIYAFLVFLVILVEVVAIVLATIYYDKVVTEGTTLFTKALQDNYEGQWTTDNGISLAIDGVQIGLLCCGINNSTDFSSAANWNKTYQSSAGGPALTATLPPTCCKFTDPSVFPAKQPYEGIEDVNCPVLAASQTTSYKDKGCWQALRDYMDNYSLTVIIASAVIAAIEIMALIFACCLKSEIAKRDDSA